MNVRSGANVPVRCCGRDWGRWRLCSCREEYIGEGVTSVISIDMCSIAIAITSIVVIVVVLRYLDAYASSHDCLFKVSSDDNGGGGGDDGGGGG